MKIIYSEDAKKQLKKLEKTVQIRIKKYLREVEELDNPRGRGKGLAGDLSGYWRYRVGDYRIICKIEDDKLIIIVFDIGHRKNIYR